MDGDSNIKHYARDGCWLRTPRPSSQQKRDVFAPEGQKAGNKDKNKRR